jgi:hypothetical protein
VIPVRPTDDDWALVVNDALSAVAVAEPGAEADFAHLYLLARIHMRDQRTPQVPTVTMVTTVTATVTTLTVTK